MRTMRGAMRDRDEVEVLCGVMRTSSGIWCTESDGGSIECSGTSLAKTRAKGGRDEVEMRSRRARRECNEGRGDEWVSGWTRSVHVRVNEQCTRAYMRVRRNYFQKCLEESEPNCTQEFRYIPPYATNCTAGCGLIEDV